MGLITAVIGVQFILNGVETVALAILKVARVPESGHTCPSPRSGRTRKRTGDVKR